MKAKTTFVLSLLLFAIVISAQAITPTNFILTGNVVEDVHFDHSTAIVTTSETTSSLLCNEPTVPNVTFSPSTVCAGSTATLNISGSLNDATNWVIYTGSCGGTLVGTTSGSTFNVTPGTTTTYFVRGEGGCAALGACGSVTVTVTPTEDASFSYPSSTFCTTDTDPLPTVTGTPGGTFTSSAGLALNPASGGITLAISTPGTYVVTYTTFQACPGSSTFSITILQGDDASFNYNSSTYCTLGADPTPTITGSAGGIFSSAAGLSLNASTGTIDVSASTPGTYSVTYTLGGSCQNNSTVSVTITTLDDASFHYSSTSYCATDPDPTPIVTGTSGGTFSSSAGLSLNSSTGTIDLSTSSAGTYSVAYTTTGGCSNSSSFSITIDAVGNPSFNYPLSTYCTNGTDPVPNITGTPGGSFTSSAGLALNPSSGGITLSISTPGTYTITYSLGGACSSSSSVTLTINPGDDASFNYSASTYCTAQSDPTPTITGTSGGTFSSSAGLVINASTGQIDLSASTPGNYSVLYTIGGVCQGSSSELVTISTLDNASFNYSVSSYCTLEADPTPTVTGVAGGTFSSTGGLAINPSSGTIDLSASSIGTYTVTYTTGGVCSNSSSVSITISNGGNASFNYSSSTYCASGFDPTPTITGTSGGTFTSTAGLSINAATGTIDVSASSAGTYSVTYTTGGTCSNSSTVSVTISTLDDASFTYNSSSYCSLGSDPTPTITGTAGGTFSSTGGLSINASTGTIDVSASAAGTYSVTYTTSGACSASSSVSITINTLDDASFSYPNAIYCTSGMDPVPTITGATGGTFTSTSGLALNPSSGGITLAISTPGTYTVTYTTFGACSNSSSVSITISSGDDASFTYNASSYCAFGADPTPTITGTPGGTFTSTAGIAINSATGTIDVSASTPGSYGITYTTNGPCSTSSTVTVTINSLDNASFNYSVSTYCATGTDPTPTISGTTGGSFTSSAGLSINASTGTIDLSASTPGTYSVTYTTGGACSNNSSVSVTINTLDDASFNYSNSTFCTSGADPVPTITGVTGGTFSSTSGLSLNPSSGGITLATSTPGTYTITYTTSGACANSSSVMVTISTGDDASFNYNASSYCSTGIDPTPTITGTLGGTFSSTGGLSINPSTGTIDVSASTPGTYSVTYTTGGPCSNSSSVSVSITTLDDASFSYGTSSFCASGSDPTPTISGTSGGTFTSTAGLSINGSTGTIDLSASTPGSYSVTYTTGGACSNSSSVSITINTLDDASFSYPNGTYCTTDTDPIPTITGVTGGTFTSTSGLSLNPSSGGITLAISTPGTYIVTYTTFGACTNSSSVSVTISAGDDASFNYNASAYCNSGVNPTPTITGVAGGTFSSTTGLTLNAASGEITLASSTPGNYVVTYTTNGSCSNSSSVNISINAGDNASFNYSNAVYCATDTDPTPIISGVTGGTFSSTAGLSINTSTGTVDLSASTLGTYIVTYTTNGVCPNSSNVSITIDAGDDASFNYSASIYCSSGVNPTPTITGVAGGTFSSTAGLTLNPTTGGITLASSTPGTYTVTYTTNGACSNSSSVSVTISSGDDASFNYSGSPYCQSGADPTPTITGLSGGTFSSTAGLSLNAATGTVDVSASLTGTYMVTYTTNGICPNSSSVSITINGLDDASFSYPNGTYCTTGADPVPTITGVTGGTFTSTAGLALNPSSGGITLAISTPGTYIVTYTTFGACTNSSSVSVTISAGDDASFNYGAATYCVSGTNPTPTITGVAGGTFTSTAGLTLNSVTGEITVASSTVGTYTVTYTTNGICPNSSNVTVTISAEDNASFNYNSATYCVTGADPTPTITGVTGGTFSSTAGVSINASTGTIDLSASTPGTYSITYTTNGICPNSSSLSITINAGDNASFNYNASTYCTVGSDPTPTVTGVTGGTFTSTAGLTLNPTTGGITLASSTPGTYIVTYTTNGACSNSSSVSVTISAGDDASFNYSGSPYCQSGADPIPTITGLAGGTFSSTAGLSINATTGAIDLSASTPSSYIVTYMTNGVCPNSSSVSITINALENASFNYNNSTYCTTGSDPTPTITGVTGGTFNSTAGLTLNASTGGITLATSTPGTYTVTYTTAGACSNSSSVLVTISTGDNASFTYNGMIYCQYDTDPTPTISGTLGGTFTSSVGLAINGSTGTIDLSASAPGTYTVSYTTNGVCPNSSNVTVTINAPDDASFSYNAAIYCPSANDPTPTITGVLGGAFSSTTGLTINSVTGEIDLSASTPGTYLIAYITNGPCPNVSSNSITIDTLADASFSYSSNSYCGTTTNPTPVVTGVSGGVFSATAGMVIDGSTGTIDLAASTPGTYTVTYSVAGTCPNSTSTIITIGTTTSETVTVNACESYSADGMTYNATGIYTYTIANSAGCDSIITLDLTIETGDYGISQSGITLTADWSDPVVTYQWIDCGTNIALLGETNQSYVPTANGAYAVISTGLACSDTSDCIEITTVGLDETDFGQYISIYPNPSNDGMFTVQYEGTITQIAIVDVSGRLIEMPVNIQSGVVDGTSLLPGAYFIQIYTNEGIASKEVVVIN